ncbi:hypothetical protein B0T10DRAFT_581843 [Thelonectria olida]|uniref:Uncharacterized protein n=1 Tax=Thelonectria olida TaxID=1576542 RepID=A0A9P9AK88_9HYPO|nr:hypothetical protein B0T10DRAFT_581843 [Thelonectria olida]
MDTPTFEKFVPAAHFFTIYHKKKDIGARARHGLVLARDARHADLCLGQPKSLTEMAPDTISGVKSSPASWSSNNQSAYLLDSEDWTASLESYEDMARKYSHTYYDGVRRNRVARKHVVNPSLMPATEVFVGPDRAVDTFTVLPHQDLFVFQPVNMYNIDWKRVATDVLGSRGEGFDGLQNYALEFDFQWLAERDTYVYFNNPPALEHISSMAIDIATTNGAEALWFIDYGLQRHDVPYPEGKAPSRKPKTFEAKDGNFVEVLGDDTRHGCPWSHVGTGVPGADACAAFLVALNDKCRAKLLAARRMKGVELVLPRFGILAYEPDAVEVVPMDDSEDNSSWEDIPVDDEGVKKDAVARKLFA